MSTYHALLDVGTHSLLTLSQYSATVGFLIEAIPNSYAQYNVNFPTYEKNFFLASVDSSEYPKWFWEQMAGRKFSEVPAEIQTQELRDRSRLASTKRDTVSKMMTSLSNMRLPITTGVIFQETTYMNKKLEALKLKDNGYEITAPHEFPHVVQYADYAGISIREAADSILFQAALDDQLLAKTDIFRIRYLDRVKRASTPEETVALMDDFLRDSFLIGIV